MAKLTKKKIKQLTVLMIFKMKGQNVIRIAGSNIMINDVVVANGWVKFREFIKENLIDKSFFKNPDCLIDRVWE